MLEVPLVSRCQPNSLDAANEKCLLIPPYTVCMHSSPNKAHFYLLSKVSNPSEHEEPTESEEYHSPDLH